MLDFAANWSQAPRSRLRAASGALLAALCLAGAARAASIASPSFQHDLLADASVNGGASSQSDPLSQNSLLPAGSVNASAAVAGAAGSAFASQFNTLTTDSFESFGSANASGAFLAPTSTGLFDASSQVVMTFQVDVDTAYTIDALLSVSESRGDGAASVVLREQDGPALFSTSLSSVADGPLASGGGTLLASKTYQIEALATGHVASGESLSGTAVAGYQLHFSLAPEPTTALLLAAGLLLLTWLGRSSRRAA